MRRALALAFLLAFLIGCTPTPLPGQTATPEATATPTSIPIPTLASDEAAPAGPLTLTIWLPPEFDPANGSPAGDLLQARLIEFSQRRDNVTIATRIKNVDGPGGILEALATGSAAAPQSLPDLVALPRAAFETAAIKGLLHPFDGLTTILDDPDWYEYARQLAHVQGSTFGIPFAGDALLMVYRPEKVTQPPLDWAASLSITNTLIFPAADPNGLFSLTLYQAAGGALFDQEERPTLDLIQLTQVYTYFGQAVGSGLMPFWLTQYESDDQAWAAYEQGQADLAITWSSRFLQKAAEDTSAAPIPTPEGAAAFTSAAGWVWALSSPNANRQVLSTQLTEFLTASDFLARWSEAARYIPPRPSALAFWQDTALQPLLNQIALSARLIPPQETLVILGPALQQSTVSLLKAESDALSAAEAAVDRLAGP
jgi:ABC-type glycerol-3-phosphate transport system substrate-binding protein